MFDQIGHGSKAKAPANSGNKEHHIEKDIASCTNASTRWKRLAFPCISKSHHGALDVTNSTQKGKGLLVRQDTYPLSNDFLGIKSNNKTNFLHKKLLNGPLPL